MRAILRWLLIAALGLGVLPAEAQVYPNIPANSLLGRLGAGQAGQPQPIPFATAAQQILSNAGPITGDILFGSGRPWCDVRAYGAKGDNSTDDTVAFTSCITQLVVGGANHLGGTLYVSQAQTGIYCLFSGLSITASLPIEIVGVGNGTPSLSTCGHDVNLLSLSNARHGVRNLNLLGPNIVGTTHDTLVLSSPCTECTVDNVVIDYGRYGINNAATDVKMTTINVSFALGAAQVYSNGSFSCSACKLDSSYPGTAPSAGTNRAAWQSSHSYSANTVVTSGGYVWQAMNAGTSGGSAPTTQPYGTYIQDNVTGTCPSPSAGVCWLLVNQTPSASVQCDTGCSTLTITNRSDLSGAFDYGLYISGTGQSVMLNNSYLSAYQYGAYDNSSVGGFIATGNECNNIIASTGICFYVRSSDDIVNSNVIITPGQMGIQTDAGKNYTFANNQIWGATVAAIYINGSVTNVSVLGNIIGSSSNWGTNAVGVDIPVSTPDYVTIIGNQCHGATTCISNSSTGTHNLIETTPGIITLNTLTMNGAITAADSGTYGSGGINGSNIGATTPGTGKFSSLTDSGLSTQGVVCNSAAGLLSTSITWCPNATPARNQTLPSNPTGTTSSTPVMAGLSNGVTRFTPVTSGNILFTISGTAQNSGSGDGCVVIIRYGTGNGPANAASSTGTTAGAPSGQQATSSPAAGNVPFSITAYATGLTLNTAYYYDLAFNAVTGGTCSLTNITMTAMEM